MPRAVPLRVRRGGEVTVQAFVAALALHGWRPLGQAGAGPYRHATGATSYGPDAIGRRAVVEYLRGVALAAGKAGG